MKRLIVTKRADDFHVHVDGDIECWGCGPTVDAAIGDLIRHNPDVFELHVWYGSNFDERAWLCEDKALRNNR
jgi:hypothetical protein